MSDGKHNLEYHTFSTGNTNNTTVITRLRDNQETRKSRGGGDDRPTPMAWGWSLDAT